MKAVFLTEGGINFGLGHLTRCISLAQAFSEKGITSKFIVWADPSVMSMLAPYQSEYINWTSIPQNLHEFLSSEDIAVIDSYSAHITIYQQIRHLTRFVIYFDDFNRLPYPAGIVINGSLVAETIPYPSTGQVTYLLGPIYQSLRRSFWNLKARQRQSLLKTIFISCGGSDIHQLTPVLTEFVSREHPGLQIVTIIGNRFNNPENEQLLPDNKLLSLYSPTEEQICQVMQNCDIAITAAGQTLYELAATGVPPIVLGVAENQRNNINGWLKTGFIEFAGWWDDTNLKNSLKLLMAKLVSDPENRESKGRIGQQLIDGQGSRRIVEKVLEYARDN